MVKHKSDDGKPRMQSMKTLSIAISTVHPASKKHGRTATRTTDRAAYLPIVLGTALLLAFSIPLSLQAEENLRDFQPPITAATVYPDRALVTRSQTVQLNRGRHRLVFKGASPNLDPASLRAFSSDKNIIVQGINSHVERRSSTVDPAQRELEDTLESLEKDRETANLAKKRLDVDLRGIRDYMDYLKRSINKQATGHAGGQSKRWQDALHFLSARRAKLETARQNKDIELRQIGEKIKRARAELSKIQTAGRRSIRIVEITLQALESTSAPVGFAYMMRNAGWNVSYGIYLKNGQTMVEYYGNLRQQTGEDWRNINLNLSTAQPAHGAAREKLRPLTVNARKASTTTVYQNVDKEVEDESGESEPSTETTSGTTGYATLDAGGNSLLFRIGKRALIESNRRDYRVTISRFETEPQELRHRLAGARQPAAHFIARLKNSQPYPMLAGAVDVYRDSGFMGRTDLRHTPSGADFLVSFGIDRQIRVKRDVRRWQENSGVLSSGRMYRTTVQLELHNDARNTRRITILERVPVSEAEEIKVQLTNKTTAGYTEDPKSSGILNWDLQLRPGEKRIITIEYEVRVPEDYPGSIFGK